MGWIGWTEDQTLDTTIPAIEAAYSGRCKMLSAIFGGGETGPPTQQDPSKVSFASQFDALAKVYRKNK
jgi:hypothetical protein